MDLIVRDKAEADIAKARAWYDQKRKGLGENFVLAIERLLVRMQKNPRAFEEVARNTRRTQLRGFPYIVYFMITEMQIEVIAVVHGKRHPRVWRSRL